VNLLAARVVLRQRSMSDALDLALPFCLANKRPLGILALVILGPIAALLGYLRIAKHWSWVPLWLLCVGASLIVQGAFTIAMGELLFKPPAETRVRTFVARFLRRLPALVFATVMRLVLLTLTLLILAPTRIFVPEAILLEGASFGKAMSRSGALARNRGGFCLGVWLAAALLPAVGAMSMDLLGNSVTSFVFQLGYPTGQLFEDGGSGFAVLGALLAVPLVAAVRFLGYIDLRTRKEGWDIQLRFVALAEQSALLRKRAA
jgi:hypothetical protein